MNSDNNLKEEVVNRIAAIPDTVADTVPEPKGLEPTKKQAKPDKPTGLIRTQQEAEWLGRLLHIALTDRGTGGLSPIMGQGSPSVNNVIAMLTSRLGEMLEALPER